MSSNLMTISQVSKMIGVSIQTLRRWDDSGKFISIRKKKTGNRYYAKNDIEDYIKNDLKDPFKLAKSWVITNPSNQPHPDFYCSNSYVLQARLIKLEHLLSKTKGLDKMFSLVSAIVGEIGNNSFDHNLGNWPDIAGILFIYNLKKRVVILADRGQGILATLKKVKPELASHQNALKIAFTEIISGRSPEHRGNGLKFVKNVVSNNKIELLFQTGNAQLKIQRADPSLRIEKSAINFHGCLALIKF